MEENLKKPIENEYLDNNFKFKEGNPGGGRPKDTEETKILKKARRELIEEYKDLLASALPTVGPIFMSKVLDGDIPAIKEYHDRVMDKASQPTDVTSKGEKIVIMPAELINKNDTTSDTIGGSTGQAQI